MEGWLLYGAYGFTGRLIAEEAKKAGMKPILAGRDEAKLLGLSKSLDMPFRVAALDDPQSIDAALDAVQAVLNVAGPFVRTAEPLARGCLRKGVHYLDITGEIPVFQRIFNLGQQAEDKGVALIPGVGFDVVPTDCLAAYVHERLPQASHLKIVVTGILRPSRGTLKTMLEFLPNGGMVRNDGTLKPFPLGAGKERFRFPSGTLDAYPIPWGDLETAWRSTGIPNITTFMALPGSLLGLGGLGIRLFQTIASKPPLRRGLLSLLSALPEGPNEKIRQKGQGFVYAQAWIPGGPSAQAWLKTPETYRFTALSSLGCLEALFRLKPKGALTPSQAFGKNFVLGIQGVELYETLP